MYGQVTKAADATNATTTFGTVAGLVMKFSVEEDEMFVDLRFDGVVSNATVNAETELDFLVDGARLGGTNGLCGATSATADAKVPVHMARLVRLTKGAHTIALQMRDGGAPAGTAKLEATTYVAVLSALRMSHNAVLAHGVDAKDKLTQ